MKNMFVMLTTFAAATADDATGRSVFKDLPQEASSKNTGRDLRRLASDRLDMRIAALERKVAKLQNLMGSWCGTISKKGACNATHGCKYENGTLIYGCRSVCHFHEEEKRCLKGDGCIWTPGRVWGGSCAYDQRIQTRDSANRVQELEATLGGVSQKLRRLDFCGQFEKSDCQEKWGCTWNNAFFFGQIGGSCESLCPNFTTQGPRVCHLHAMCTWNPKKNFCVHKNNEVMNGSGFASTG